MLATNQGPWHFQTANHHSDFQCFNTKNTAYLLLCQPVKLMPRGKMKQCDHNRWNLSNKDPLNKAFVLIMGHKSTVYVPKGHCVEPDWEKAVTANTQLIVFFWKEDNNCVLDFNTIYRTWQIQSKGFAKCVFFIRGNPLCAYVVIILYCRCVSLCSLCLCLVKEVWVVHAQAAAL